jgi:pimeloyl-ACP methyl ester carboxylesterase
MVSLVGDVRALVEEVALGEPAIVGHSLGASIAAVYAAAHGARAVVCVDQSLRFGEFRRARAGACRGRAQQRRNSGLRRLALALQLQHAVAALLAKILDVSHGRDSCLT